MPWLDRSYGDADDPRTVLDSDPDANCGKEGQNNENRNECALHLLSPSEK
jgi:hypothetical protein